MKNRKKLISALALTMAVVILSGLVLSIIPSVGAASSSEIQQQINNLKGQKEEIRGQMAQLQAQYEENEDEIANLVAKKNIIDQEIFLLHAQIDNMNQQISAYNLLIADKQDELDNAQANLDALNTQHKDRIRIMEEEGEISYWSVLFKAKSLADFLDRLSMIEEIAASDQRRLNDLREAAENVDEARESLTEEKAELQAAREELDATNSELEGKRLESLELITELLEKSVEIEGLQAEFEAQEEILLAEIAAKEKEYNEAKHQEWLAHMATYTTVPPETTMVPEGPTENPPAQEEGSEGSEEEPEAPTETQAPSAVWLVPCSYVKLTSPFGNRDQPTAGASTYHQGVDLAGPEGTPIYASRTGIVTTASYGNAAGYYVSINHGDGFSSIYMHMTHYVVSPGQAVSAGQLIGYMGKTGVTTGFHLHFGISYNGVYVNPVQYVPLY